MLSLFTRVGLALLLTAIALPAPAQSAGKAAPDPQALLRAAKLATGGSAWDAFTTQKSVVRVVTGGMTGSVERWVDILGGRSFLKYAIGPLTGAQGFDGKIAWSQDGSGQARAEISTVARELAVNAAYRDKLAFWFPERGRAAIEFKEHATAGAQGYEVILITPEAGRPFEFWINSDNKVIERLVETEGAETRTEVFGDFRATQGVKLPFRVRAQRGSDARHEEIVVVERIEYNVPLDGISFAQPGAPAADWKFPEGRQSVEVPFELANGHMYVQVRIDGKGPFRMLFDTGAINVIVPEAAQSLGLKPEGALPATGTGEAKEDVGLVRVSSLEIGGIKLNDPLFAVVGLRNYARRIEGVEMDGLVGYEILKRFPARIDYEARRVTFYQPESFRYSGTGARLPFRFKNHVPQVDGSIDGIPGAFDLDTGARTSLTLAGPFWKTNQLDAKYDAKRQVIAGVGLGGPSRALLARAKLLKLGDAEVRSPVTMLSTATAGAFADEGYAGNVGYGVLRRFTLVFDYPREQVFLEPNAAHAGADVYDRSGLWVERGDKGWELIEVVPEGPAAVAGLKAGDFVVAIDGQKVGDVKLSDLRERLRGGPGTKLRLKLSDGRERTLVLKDLI